MDDFTKEALQRIYAASQSLERGEENPVECAQDIQRMCHNAMNGRLTFPWSHTPSPDLSS